MYKAVIFDLDGTLVNSLEDLANSVNKGLLAVGLPTHSVEEYRYFVGNGRDKLIERAIGNAALNEKEKETVRTVYDEDYAIHSNDNTCEYAGCTQLLENLTKMGIKTAVLTNKPQEFVAPILKKIYPNHSFTLAWGNSNRFKTKPDPEALLAMLKELGISKNECLYIGDSDVDVFTANNAGVDMVGACWGFRGKDELIKAGAKMTAEKPLDIMEFIK